MKRKFWKKRRSLHGKKQNEVNLCSFKKNKEVTIVFRCVSKNHESFDEIDSEKMYPFYLEKETSFAEDSGERKVRHPYPPNFELIFDVWKTAPFEL